MKNGETPAKKRKFDVFNFFYSIGAVVILIGVIAKFLEWKLQDPLTALRESLIANHAVTVSELDAIDSAIATEVNLVFEKVRIDPFPTLSESMRDVYA